jgi:hypothetical protein
MSLNPAQQSINLSFDECCIRVADLRLVVFFRGDFVGPFCCENQGASRTLVKGTDILTGAFAIYRNPVKQRTTEHKGSEALKQSLTPPGLDRGRSPDLTPYPK